jgi:hypothetical protein
MFGLRRSSERTDRAVSGPELGRRGFLGLLGGAAAELVFDPERALWVPGKKLISIPAPSEDERILRAIAEITRQQQVIINSFQGLIFVHNTLPIYDSEGLHARGVQ